MQLILAPFFIGGLILTNILFIFRLFFIKLQKQSVLFVLICLSFIQFFFLYSSQNHKNLALITSSKEYEESINQLIASNNSKTYKIEKNSQIVKNELTKINTLLLQQPTHRDLLINQALLSYHLGKRDYFHNKLNEAINIDPNHHFLQMIRNKQEYQNNN